MTALWRGMTNMSITGDNEVIIVGGDGAAVWDAQGRRYLDGTASLWYCNVGHGRTEIADAARHQMATLAAFHTFDVYANQPAIQLAERLSALAPMPDAKVFFTPGGGSDAIDTACKLARRYWAVQNRPDKTTIVSRRHGYHGMDAYGTSLAGIPANSEGYNGPLIADVAVVQHDSVEAVRALFETSAGHIAAFIGEPVIGSGGVRPPAPDYWPAVAALCKQFDVLLISDEVICAFGRLGAWFGCQKYDYQPDMITCAKGLTSGYLPLGAVITSGELADPFFRDGAPMLRHGFTYAGHPTACAAAMANLDIIERENLVDRVAELEPWYAHLVHDAFDNHPLFGDVRTAGLLAGVEVKAEIADQDPMAAARIAAACRDFGLITRAIGPTLQLSPPLITSRGDIALMVDAITAACNSLHVLV